MNVSRRARIAYELRNPDNRDERTPIEAITAIDVGYFKAPPSATFEDKEEEKTLDGHSCYNQFY